jgi:hypothetical protein
MFTLMKDILIGLLFVTVYITLMIPYKIFDLYMWFKLKKKKREKL